MSYELSARAQRDLREHLYFIAASDPRAAVREGARIHAELSALAR